MNVQNTRTIGIFLMHPTEESRRVIHENGSDVDGGRARKGEKGAGTFNGGKVETAGDFRF
jgi:hypothetical protein